MTHPAALAVVALVALGIMRGPLDNMGAVLAEMAKRRVAESVSDETQAQAAALAAELRTFYYEKQGGFLRSAHKRRATRKTRRSGATTGGIREVAARCLGLPRYRAVYCNETRNEAKQLAWRSDTQSGIIDLLDRHGKMRVVRGVTTYDIGGLVATVHKDELAVDFSNGSRFEFFCADDEGAIERLRGRAKHLLWIDEAQKFRHLEAFYKGIVVGCLTDFADESRGGPLGGECWLSGTPARDCAGFFFDVTKDPDDHEQPLPGWEVHELRVTDNPYFGETAEQRWANTALRALEENGWTEDDPDFQREWLARWVKTDARYVFPVNAVPDHRLTFAPMRTDAAGWYDHAAAIADLPAKPNGRPYTWLYAIGIDFGYSPHPFAIVVWAYTHDLPDIWEMFSWKKTKVLADDQLAYVEAIYSALDNVVVLVGDPGGQAGEKLQGWRERGGLPIEDADKAGKWTWIELMGTDIRKGRVHFRSNSPMLHEMRHLVELATKPGKPRKEHSDRRLADGTVPGDDCAFAGLYAFRHLTHYLHRPPPSKLTPGSPEAAKAEENRIESEIDEREQRRDQDEDADGWTSLGDDGGYQW